MTILCFHAVDPRWQSPLALGPREFAAHCTWLARHRTVVPLEVALAHLTPQGRLPRGMVALTFDDGLAQLAEHVFPVLERHRLPATVFLVTSTLTPQGHPVDWVDTPPAWPLHTLSREQVLEARDRGFGFASHSWAHRTLPDLAAQECVADLTDSRELLEDVLGKPVRILAYPRGRHDAMVRSATRRAGYTHGLALPEGPEDPGPYAVPRAGVFPGNGAAVLRAKTSRRYQVLRQSAVYPRVRASLRRASPRRAP